MYTLTYKSISTKPIISNDMESLLEKARINNKREGLTGCLIYYNGVFVQILEGSKKKIEALYEKINVDNRHKNVTIFSTDEISERTFPNWGMAYYPLEDSITSKQELEQFRKNLTLLSDLVKPTNFTVKNFWQEIKIIISNPPT